MARIAFVSNLIDADSGGGLGAFVAAQAKTLAGAHQVLVITDESRAELAAAVFKDTPEVEIAFAGSVPDGEEQGSYFSEMHKWSAQVLACLRAHYGSRGPDLIEFADYHGSGAVTVQAAQAGEEFLRETVVAVRIHTSAEICSVLNGAIDDDFASKTVFGLERFALAGADRIFYAGGDIGETMRRFYGDANLGPLSLSRHACRFPISRTEPPARDPEDPLRLLYFGRLEHRKGVQNLTRALASASSPVQLTMVGGDTQTGPMETSMLDNLLRGTMKSQVKILGAVPHEELGELIDAHDAVVVPSLWECWPYTALESLARNRPVLATKVGGLVEIVGDGEAGMLQRGTSFQNIAGLIERAWAARDELASWTAAGGPIAQFERLTNPQPIVESYEAAIALGTVRKALTPGWTSKYRPLVSVVIPYFKMAAYVDQTVESIRAQTYPNIEIVIVNDGSLEPEDVVLQKYLNDPGVEVVTQLNSGLGAARNFGIDNSRGGYFLPLDADDTIDPEYVTRAVTLLESDPSLGYVCCWTKYFTDEDLEADPEIGYQPIGAALDLNRFGNVAGHSGSVFRRDAFDAGEGYSEELASFEDWEYYQELERRGVRGVVIPERLYNYRVRGDSMLRTVATNRLAYLEAEKRASLVYRRVEWAPQNG